MKKNKGNEKFARYSREVAAEGSVLLKNDNETLPIQVDDKIAVFGRMQLDWYRCGTGSGGSVNIPYKTNLIDSLYESKVAIDEPIAKKYREWIRLNPFNDGGSGWASEPWFQEEMVLDEICIVEASLRSNKAIVVIGRTAGEDKDNSDEPGSYKLTIEESKMLHQVARHFKNVIVILNVSNHIDMSWLNDKALVQSIKSVLYAWHGGMEGGRAIVDILTGRVNPSGKLTDTIAYSISDYPSDSNYNNPLRNVYQEDIYVGYRYFETFCPDKVQFEFGYGLSYTEFSIEAVDVEIQYSPEETLEFTVEVINRGGYAGKEVIQIYYTPPQGVLGKPVKILGAFAKTKLLSSGEKQCLKLRIPVVQMASFDDVGLVLNKSLWVLEKGFYKFHVGNSIRNTQLFHEEKWLGYYVEQDRITQQCNEAMSPSQSFKRMKPGVINEDGTYCLSYENTLKRTIPLKERIYRNLPLEYKITENMGFLLQDVAEERVTMEAFIAQLNDEELATLVRGEGMNSPWVTSGTASAFGGISKKLFDYGIPIACCADGPSGIRMDGGGVATQIPIGTLLSATWNVGMVETLFKMEGEEMCHNNIDILLGPSLNIRRHPLNGRNFEYYSEDPLISGEFAAAACRGIKAGGGLATIKHFACNNQEKERHSVDAIVSERALREIYLKGFEIAVKKGKACAIMTSYNPINGFWAASNYDLNTTILRKEWGFTGLVMTDWWAKMNHPIDGGVGSRSNTGHMLRAQNDLYMVVNNFGAEVNSGNDNTISSLNHGDLTRSELQRSAMNICRFLMQTNAFFARREFKERVVIIKSNPVYKSKSSVRISETPELSVKLNENNHFFVNESGDYRVYVTIKYDKSTIAQTECNVLLNNQHMCLIQTNGTDGKWISQKLVKVNLNKGYYNLTFEFIKSGMDIQKLKFIKE